MFGFSHHQGAMEIMKNSWLYLFTTQPTTELPSHNAGDGTNLLSPIILNMGKLKRFSLTT
jgi:hypothetical protein